MILPSGHTECFFYSLNRFTTASFEQAKELALKQMLNGWKVGIEQDNKTKEYTVYWGA